MASRFDVMYAKESNGNTYWTKCGVAFPFKNNKEGYQLMLDAIPAPTEGVYKFTLFPPKENGGGSPKVETYTPRGRPTAETGTKSAFDSGGMDDDTIPF